MITDLYIKASAPASASRSTATLMKTGQTTSYRTGDDGDLEAGRATSFTVLAENNPFGNTNRFTDELGGQTYTNNWVIDWSTYDGSTVLGYYRVVQGGGITNWNNSIDAALGTFGTFSGCRMTNLYELLNISRVAGYTTNFLNYSPINHNTGGNLWVSSTTQPTTTNAYIVIHGTSIIVTSMAKTNNASYMVCRTFTVTGTTLS